MSLPLNNWILSQYFIDEINLEYEINNVKKQIKKIQENQNVTSECFLSFYPLAKNLRFVSSHFYNSIINNLKPSLSNEPRKGEPNFWFHKTQQDWMPWMWTRFLNKNSNNRESWSNLFRDIEETISIDYTAPQKLITQIDLEKFLLYLSCLGHIFRIDNDFMKIIEDKTFIKTQNDEKVCGLQIRRGEMVPKGDDLSKSWEFRKLFPIEDYIIGLEKVCNFLQTDKVFVSTDSIETIQYLKKNYKNFNFIENNYDKNNFIRFEGNGAQLELDLSKKPELIRHYTESCISDLLSLSNCDGYVGGMTKSEYGICGWFLQIITQKKITPYYNVEGNLDLQNKEVGMLLI